MAAIAIRKSAFDNATEVQRKILRLSAARFLFGAPALYLDGTVRWYVFSDDRYDLTDVAYLGTLTAGLAQLPTTADPTRQQVVDWVKSRVVLPKDIPDLDKAPNPWQAVLNANNAPSAVRAAAAVPSSWSPIGS